MSLRIAISAGETSGDEHAAEFVRALQIFSPGCTVRGMGGRALRETGTELVVDAEKSASVMGFGELLGSLRQVTRALSDLKSLLRSWRPDALVLIDYPDFNLRLAKAAKALGIKVFYFITPKVWAWRGGRVKTIARLVDQAAVIFPFEPDFFRSRGFEGARYVGHPFAGREDLHRASAAERADFCGALGLDSARPLVAIFPGSRRGEIKFHVETVLRGIELLRRDHPEIQLAVAVAPGLSVEALGISGKTEIPIAFTDQPIALLRAADAGLIKSGTSNLQAAYCDLPFAMFYHAGFISKLIVKTIIPISEYSIVNVIRPKTVRELVLQHFTPSEIAGEISALLFNEQRRVEMQRAFAEIRERLGSAEERPEFAGCRTAYERTARMLIDLLEKRSR